MREELDIITAYQKVGTYRGAADICGTTHKTVKRVVERHAAGQDRPVRAPRPANYEDVRTLVAQDVKDTRGRISAKRLLPRARAAGYTGSARNFRRLVAQEKKAWRAQHGRTHRPASWSPGEHLVIDWGVIAGVHVFAAVLAWSRFRFVRFAADEKAATTMAIKGVGPAVGAQLLITAGDNPDRLRTSASFAALCGTAPIPLSSGRTDKHRLSRGGDRQANAALHHTSKSACPTTREPAPTATPAWPTGGPRRRSSAPSNAPSHERSSTPWPATPSRPTTPTYDPHATRRTSPSPPPHNTSAYGPPESANSNSGDAPTTNSPPATEPGSPPPETPPSPKA